MAKLSEFFAAEEVAREGEFETLGYADSMRAGTLAFADSVRYARLISQNRAVSCLITTRPLVDEVRDDLGLVVCEAPRKWFYDVHERWMQEARYRPPFEPHRGIHCQIHPTAVVSPDAWIGDHVEIGEHVVIRSGVKLGAHAIIEPGVKLGVEGILYHRLERGVRIIKHGGWVEIGDHTAILSNAIVVRSVHDTEGTMVGSGVVVGLGSVVGHESQVGDGVVISNHCVLARRCRVAHGAFLGTGAFIREHVEVGAGAQVMAGAVVIEDVKTGATVSGNFASDHKTRLLNFTRARLVERKSD